MHSRLGSQLWGCSEVEEVKESTGAGGISTYRLVAECFVAFSLVHVELVLTYALLRYHITFEQWTTIMVILSYTAPYRTRSVVAAAAAAAAAAARIVGHTH